MTGYEIFSATTDKDPLRKKSNIKTNFLIPRAPISNHKQFLNDIKPMGVLAKNYKPDQPTDINTFPTLQMSQEDSLSGITYDQ